MPRIDGWVQTVFDKSIAGKVMTGAGETTYACAYNWNSNIPASGTERRGVVFGAYLSFGNPCALGSADSAYTPSFVSALVGGGFRADVAG